MSSSDTPRKPSVRLISLAFQTHWLMLPAEVQRILEIMHRSNEFDPEALLSRYPTRQGGTRTALTVDDVAIIPIIGPIVPRANLFTEISGATSAETAAADLGAALRDPNVRGIVLSIDSPGGAASGIDELAGMIYRARGRKPIIAHVSGTAASAAYWIASAADEIVINAAAMVGSVGVVATIHKRADDTIEIVSSQSPNKRPDAATDAGRAEYQRIVDALADVFVDHVATYRGVTRENVLNKFGAGGLMVGAQAVAMGMADRLGSEESAIAAIRAGTTRAAPRARTAAEAAQAAAITAEAAGLMKMGDDAARKARWLADRRLRDEFGTFGAFEAYERAAERGKVSLIRDRTLKGKPSRGPRPL